MTVLGASKQFDKCLFFFSIYNSNAMATINNNLYIRVQERMKEKGFTEQEIKTIDEARGKLRTHSKTIMRFLCKTK